jgi:hypothetical protein
MFNITEAEGSVFALAVLLLVQGIGQITSLHNTDLVNFC